MRTFAEHIAETHSQLDAGQQLRFRAYLTAAAKDGDDPSSLTWADCVAAGWDTMNEQDAHRILTAALQTPA